MGFKLNSCCLGMFLVFLLLFLVNEIRFQFFGLHEFKIQNRQIQHSAISFNFKSAINFFFYFLTKLQECGNFPPKNKLFIRFVKKNLMINSELQLRLPEINNSCCTVIRNFFFVVASFLNWFFFEYILILLKEDEEE